VSVVGSHIEGQNPLRFWLERAKIIHKFGLAKTFDSIAQPFGISRRERVKVVEG